MKELTKAEELILVTIWRLGENAYGVPIKRKIKETTGKDFAYGTLYFLLDQLTGKEFVNRIKGDPTPERGGRGKTFYELTPEGMDALKSSVEMHQKVFNGIETVIFEKVRNK
ncbi:PadR family transcriptional regulator [candidate division KSB1 bacterium]